LLPIFDLANVDVVIATPSCNSTTWPAKTPEVNAGSVGMPFGRRVLTGFRSGLALIRGTTNTPATVLANASLRLVFEHPKSRFAEAACCR
jgi:hypothetical protein